MKTEKEAMYTQRHRVHGLTINEVVLAMVVLGMLLGSVAQGVALSVRMQRSTAERVRGHLLANNLLGRILELPYEDPAGSDTIGTDDGEIPSDHTSFDDIDDYNGWSESPPLGTDGTARSDLDGWTLTVDVVWVTLDSTVTPSIGETGVKKVTVRAIHQDLKAAAVDCLRFLGASVARE